jgi:hypothetical protein
LGTWGEIPTGSVGGRPLWVGTTTVGLGRGISVGISVVAVVVVDVVVGTELGGLSVAVVGVASGVKAASVVSVAPEIGLITGGRLVWLSPARAVAVAAIALGLLKTAAVAVAALALVGNSPSVAVGTLLSAVTGTARVKTSTVEVGKGTLVAEGGVSPHATNIKSKLIITKLALTNLCNNPNSLPVTISPDSHYIRTSISSSQSYSSQLRVVSYE